MLIFGLLLLLLFFNILYSVSQLPCSEVNLSRGFKIIIQNWPEIFGRRRNNNNNKKLSKKIQHTSQGVDIRDA